ncbi:hypothetical protein EB796_002232 [Bugula neritina]|uniref:ABC transporter domain-containing protein n=1 Tax=Bugula neritina TaxID=10212 RepID=A0A7J7KMR4_BUGNE|nr:hypothetical protein EB796_002232 [Bugula neritina]
MYSRVSHLRYDTLTPGESQRLAMVRVLYHQPRLLFLDEATSQVQIEIEKKFYAMLQASNISYISIGHSNTLKEHHHKHISILNHSFSISSI